MTSSAVSSIVPGRSYPERAERVLRPVHTTVAPASPRAAAIPRPAPRVARATTATRPRKASCCGDNTIDRVQCSSHAVEYLRSLSLALGWTRRCPTCVSRGRILRKCLARPAQSGTRPPRLRRLGGVFTASPVARKVGVKDYERRVSRRRRGAPVPRTHLITAGRTYRAATINISRRSSNSIQGSPVQNDLHNNKGLGYGCKIGA